MATNNPQGLRPIGHRNGNPWNQTANTYAIATDASNTYAIGDVVKSAAGTDVNGIPLCVKATSGDVPLGIIVGFQTAPTGSTSLQGTNLNLNQLWLAKNAGTQYVFVVDDPDIIFEAQMDSTAITLANLHKNSNLTITADQTSALSQSAPYSNTVLTGSTVNTTNSFVIRMMGLVQRVDNAPTSTTVGGAYCKVKCCWNQHEFNGGFTAS
jgi:hypothetical protein